MNHIMIQFPAQKPVNYDIHIGTGLLMNPENWLPEDYHTKKIVIITDDTVKDLYAEKVVSLLEKFNPVLLSFPAGEKSKQADTKKILDEKMIEKQCTRQTLILALGGGVVGDMAGFVASTYMRGIPYIQIPTTLLSMVDSSVGGKTGINTAYGKNLIGAFWQPQKVLADINFLSTLPHEHMVNGLIEAIKMCLTNDAENFEFIKNNLDKVLNKEVTALKHIVHSAVKIKAGIVMRDEKENHERMVCNFGHTIGHAIEKVTDYNIMHGYAVALGMLVEAKIAEISGFLPEKNYQEIKNILASLDIHSAQLNEFDTDTIINATKIDKKIRSNEVRYVVLNNIGSVYNKDNYFAHAISDDVVKKAMNEVQHDR